MRGLCLTLVLLLTVTFAFAQPAPDIVWTQTYGAYGTNWAGAVLAVSDGGFVACGMVSPPNAPGDGWLFKTNGDGIQTWSRTIGGAGQDELRRIVPTSDGGYILCGMTQTNESGQQAFLVKTDAEGISQWANNYGGPGDEYAWDVRQLRNGSYVFCGQTNSYGAGETDVWLVKVNSDGTQAW